MDEKDDKPIGDTIRINEARIKDHLGEMVRGAVEETLNTLLDAEADQLCGAARYERTEVRSVSLPAAIGVKLVRTISWNG